jgi:hypothetical protein
MTKIANGTIDGLTWYEVPKGAPDGGDLVVVTRGETPPATRADAKRLMSSTSWRYGMYAVDLQWFRPFDAASAFPGKTVKFREGKFKDADVTAWMNEHLDIPDDLDVWIEHRWNDLNLVARTMRKGLEVLITRPLRTDVTLREALAVEMPYLTRHCRRPPDESGPRCRSYLNAMMTHMTDHAARIHAGWISSLSDPRNDATTTLRLPGDLVRAAGVREATLTYDAESNSVRATIIMSGGHRLEEDDTGLELSLSEALPASVRIAVVGLPLSDVIGAAWADSLKIKTVRSSGPDEPTSMRIHCEGEPLSQPAGTPLQREEADRILERLGRPGVGNAGEIRRISVTAVQALEGMDPGDMATALTLLTPGAILDLEPFGRPGWKLRSQSGTIVVERSPSLGYGEAFARLTRRNGA